MENELDDLNQETFGDSENGDWELEHEKFVTELGENGLSPSPHEIPKFWETAELSDFWSAGDLDVSRSFDSVLNLEETVDKLVCEDEFLDPAVLNVSKHPPRDFTQPPVPLLPTVNLLNEPDIWAVQGPSKKQQVEKVLKKNHPAPDLVQALMTSMRIDGDFSPNSVACPDSTQADISQLNYVKNSIALNNTLPSTLIKTNRPDYTSQSPHLPNCSQTIHPMQQHRHLLNMPKPLSREFPTELQNFRSRPFNLRNSKLPFLTSSTPLNTVLSPSPLIPPRPGLLSGPMTSRLLHPGFPTPPLIPPPGILYRPIVPPPNVHFNLAYNPHKRFMPLDESSLLNVLFARIEAEQPEMSDFDPYKSAWVTPYEQLIVLRSCNVENPYVEEYYFAVKWLRMMAKIRERKVAEGVPSSTLPPPYFHLSAPVTSTLLFNPDHHHRIAMRCRFIIVPGKSKKQQVVGSKPTLNGTSMKSEVSAAAGLFCTQLGRPTKSNINTQRIIADLSISTVLDDDQEEKSDPELSFTATAATHTTDTTTARPTTLNSFSPQYQSIIKQRRRLVILARIERLYATILNIDETNVSLARIFVKNEESRHLMGHRLSLLKILHRDLFLSTSTSPLQPPETSPTNNEQSEVQSSLSPTQPHNTRHLILDFFEIPKGIRLFPLLLRFLFPNDRQFCVSEFISHFTQLNKSAVGGIDAYAQLLYGPIRDVIYKDTEDIKALIQSCIHLPFASVNALVSDELEPNAVTMFSSRLGVSLFICLLDACARNSQRDDPSLFCELFIYACRIVGHLAHTELPTPLENFAHFARLDPQFLMPKTLADAYTRNGLPQYGALLRWLAVRVSTPGQPPQIRKPHPPSTNSSNHGSPLPQNRITLT